MRQTSWYIWFHSTRGSTYTSIPSSFSAPSPGFGAAAVGTMNQVVGAPEPESGPGGGPCRYNAFSPFADTSKTLTSPTNGSVFRVLRSNFETLKGVGPSSGGTEGCSTKNRIPGFPGSSPE